MLEIEKDMVAVAETVYHRPYQFIQIFSRWYSIEEDKAKHILLSLLDRGVLVLDDDLRVVKGDDDDE